MTAVGSTFLESFAGHSALRDSLTVSNDEPPRAWETPRRTPPMELPAGKGEGILAVDDEPAVAAMVERILKRLGYRPTVCTDPRRALELFQASPGDYDLLLTDLTMPELSGIELARAMLDLRPDLCVVLSSGFVGTCCDSLLPGAERLSVIYKPVTMMDLAVALRDALA